MTLAFLVLSLFGFWQLLNPDWHWGGLLAFGAAAVLSLIPLLRLRWPTQEAALARLEQISGLKHRPVTSYGDVMITPGSDQASQALWEAHRQRLSRMFGKLRAGWPAPRVDRKDPFALRAALLLLFAVAVIVNRSELQQKVAAAFDVKPSLRLQSLRIDAWVNPPAYTLKPPLLLADGRMPVTEIARQTEIAPVLENSEIVARIHHRHAQQFKLRLLSQAQGESIVGESIVLAPNDGESRSGIAEFRYKLSQSATLVVEDGGTELVRFPITVIDDLPPSISLTEAPSLTQRQAMHLKYKVQDDYGVIAARAMINEERRDDAAPSGGPGALSPKPGEATTAAPPSKRLGEPPVIPLPLPRAGLKSGEAQIFKDLTSHPWAGLPVTMTLIAEDQAGQIGGTDAGRFILPERAFKQPLARALIEQRKKLVNRPDQPEIAARAIDALTIAPESYFTDLSLYLGLRSVFWRLKKPRGLEDIESAVAQLWDMALKIEDGDLPDAERRLREAQERLAKALDENASEDEIKRLMEELRQALSEFMQAMQQNAQQQEQQQQSPGQQRITSQDLDKILKNIEDLAKTGSRDAARQLLSELQQMLENAQAGRQQQQSGQMQEMMSMVDQLSDLLSRQQQLLNETFQAQREQQQRNRRQGQQNGENEGEPRAGERGEPRRNGQRGEAPSPGAQPGSLEDLRQRQEELMRELQNFRNQMQGLNPNVRQKLDDAARAMGEAGEQLGDRNAARAAEREGAAVESLRQGAKALAEQMMQSRRGNEGQGLEQGGNARTDPLGRPNRTHGADDGDNVKVPDEIDIQRAREILDELRRRLGERYRPELELDYLDRLIKRF